MDGPVAAVSVGLPVYNGARYLPEAIDSLLSQTFTDFELIISDNASTDATAHICRRYADRDSRIRYVRQPENLGAIPNHNLLVDLARGRYFKWVGHDDVYEPDLVARCVESLEVATPDVILANVWDGVVDAGGRRSPTPYPLDATHPSAHRRFRSLLHEDGGNDMYGMVRTETLRRIRPMGSFLHADRVLVAELILNGRFKEVPEVLYYRREHPGRTSHGTSARAVVTKLDPRRSGQSTVRVYVEYVGALFASVFRARLSRRERALCLRELVWFLLGRMRPSVAWQVLTGKAPPADAPIDPTLAS